MTRILPSQLFVAQARLFTLLAPRDFREGTQEGPVRFFVARTAKFFLAADGKVKKGFTSRVE
jgi:hypothetical protein